MISIHRSPSWKAQNPLPGKLSDLEKLRSLEHSPNGPVKQPTFGALYPNLVVLEQLSVERLSQGLAKLVGPRQRCCLRMLIIYHDHRRRSKLL